MTGVWVQVPCASASTPVRLFPSETWRAMVFYPSPGARAGFALPPPAPRDEDRILEATVP